MVNLSRKKRKKINSFKNVLPHECAFECFNGVKIVLNKRTFHAVSIFHLVFLSEH